MTNSPHLNLTPTHSHPPYYNPLLYPMTCLSLLLYYPSSLFLRPKCPQLASLSPCVCLSVSLSHTPSPSPLSSLGFPFSFHLHLLSIPPTNFSTIFIPHCSTDNSSSASLHSSLSLSSIYPFFSSLALHFIFSLSIYLPLSLSQTLSPLHPLSHLSLFPFSLPPSLSASLYLSFSLPFSLSLITSITPPGCSCTGCAIGLQHCIMIQVHNIQ